MPSTAVTTKSEEEEMREFAAKIVRGLARAALNGSEGALIVLRESKDELLQKWIWIDEVKELFRKGLIR